MKHLTLIALFFGLCTTQSIKFGRCLNPNDVYNFPQDGLVGSWNVIRRTKNVPLNKKDCERLVVSAKAADGRYPVKIIQYDIAKQEHFATFGFLFYKKPAVGSTPGSSSGTLEQTKWIPGKGDFRIFRTSGNPFDAFSVYSCQSYLGIFKREFMWLLKTPTSAIFVPTFVTNSLTEITNLKQTDLQEPLHTANCQYLP